VEQAKLGAIFGAGRSGSTLLGAIVSSHPDVAYRFEPVHRSQGLAPEAENVLARLRSGTLASTDIPEIHRALLPANPEWEKPPFFRKRYPTRMATGRSVLWPVARRSAAISQFFRYLYTPRNEPYIVFKEVQLEDAARGLLLGTSVAVVVLLRHPCATVVSILAGQKRNLMPIGRQKILARILVDHAPDLHAQYAGRLEALSDIEKEALIWRVSVERYYQAVQQSGRGRLVFYEQLCREPMAIAEEVLGVFGLSMEPQVRDFIEAATRPRPWSALRYGDLGSRDYFSVFRDPLQSMNSWKQRLSGAERAKVISVVRDSAVFQAGVRAAHWED
jgi:hypothetical protein